MNVYKIQEQALKALCKSGAGAVKRIQDGDKTWLVVNGYYAAAIRNDSLFITASQEMDARILAEFNDYIELVPTNIFRVIGKSKAQVWLFEDSKEVYINSGYRALFSVGAILRVPRDYNGLSAIHVYENGQFVGLLMPIRAPKE